MDTLFLKIYERFDANQQLFTDNSLPPVAHIDLYRGQPIAPERFEVFKLPALFIGYNIPWDKNKGQGLLTLDVHVMLDANHSTANISPNRLKGLEILKYYRLVDAVLRYTESEHTSKLMLVNERPVEADVVNYHILSYEATITDMYLKHEFEEGGIDQVNFEGGRIKKFIL